MRAAFGKVNTLHNHVLPWTDRPLVTDNLVGGEDGIDDAGVSVTRSFPLLKVCSSRRPDSFSEGIPAICSIRLFVSSQKSDVSAVAHLRGYRDITESTNLDVGFPTLVDTMISAQTS